MAVQFATKAESLLAREYPFVIACGDATLPLLSLRDIFPRPGEVGPQGDGFSGGVAIRRPLGGAGERSEPEGVTPQGPQTLRCSEI